MTSPVARPLAWLFSKIHRRELEMLEGWPGPTPIWPLGNVLQLLGGDLHLLFDEWRAKWGDVVVFWVLGQPTHSRRSRSE